MTVWNWNSVLLRYKFLLHIAITILNVLDVVYLKCFSPSKRTALCAPEDLLHICKRWTRSSKKTSLKDFNSWTKLLRRRNVFGQESSFVFRCIFAPESMTCSLLQLQRMFGCSFTDKYCCQQQRKVSFPPM